jgi:hypothetical protein
LRIFFLGALAAWRFNPYFLVLRRGFGHEAGKLLGLQAQSDKDVLKTVQGSAFEKLLRKVDRESGRVLDELADQFGAVQAGDQVDQLFDLIVLQHPIPPSACAAVVT